MTSTGSKKPPSVKLVGKKVAMKTKTIVDALQTLSLVPSFSTTDFGGDILPENILVKNILEGSITLGVLCMY